MLFGTAHRKRVRSRSPPIRNHVVKSPRLSSYPSDHDPESFSADDYVSSSTTHTGVLYPSTQQQDIDPQVPVPSKSGSRPLFRALKLLRVCIFTSVQLLTSTATTPARQISIHVQGVLLSLQLPPPRMHPAT
jgi:hypothetical protein